MSEAKPAEYVRVVADVTFRGEWFIPIGEDIATAADAENYVRFAVRSEDPENILVAHTATVHSNETFVTDEDGERLTDAS